MYQSLTIVGNLGRDPEMRYLPDGTAVTNLNVASSRKYNNREGQPIEETTWYKVTVWNKQAETVNQYLAKGSKVLVEGTLTPDPTTGGPRLWTRQDGSVGASYEMRANTVRFLSSRGDNNGHHGNFNPETGEPGIEDDIPF